MPLNIIIMLRDSIMVEAAEERCFFQPDETIVARKVGRLWSDNILDWTLVCTNKQSTLENAKCDVWEGLPQLRRGPRAGRPGPRAEFMNMQFCWR